MPEKSYPCHICRSRPATGVYLLNKRNGSQEVKMACTPCWFTEIYPRETVESVIFLHSLLAPERNNEAPECENGLTPTGSATVLKTIEDIPQLIGVFLEMRCVKCGFTIDVDPKNVMAAKQSYLHPNFNYDKHSYISISNINSISETPSEDGGET